MTNNLGTPVTPQQQLEAAMERNQRIADARSDSDLFAHLIAAAVVEGKQVPSHYATAYRVAVQNMDEAINS